MRTFIACLALACAGFSSFDDDSDDAGARWVYVQDAHSVHMSGSTSDVLRAGRALGKEQRGLWFVRDGKEYIVTDGKLLARVEALMAPIAELGKKQGALGKRQGQLGKKQGELGRRMAQLARSGAEREMDDLGRQQDELGRQQDELGRQQDELGRQQERAVQTMRQKLEELEKQAIAGGLAKAI